MLNNRNRFAPVPRLALLAALLLSAAPCQLLRAQTPAQGTQPPAATAPTAAPADQTSTGLKITFLPPPLEGTLSLGVFDRGGKLVRTLRAEAAMSDFTVGLNGLILFWDGLDDSGKPVASGKYRVRGFAVGDVEISGEAFHGNDWVESEDSPHPYEFRRIRVTGDRLELIASDRAGKEWRILQPLPEGELSFQNPEEPTPADAQNKGDASRKPGPRSCAGRDGTKWSIEQAVGETVVVQMNAQGEVLRRLNVGAGQPPPVGIAASLSRDEIFLLENEADHWRVRGLRRRTPPGKAATAGPVAPSWETFLEKNRWPCTKLSDALTRLGKPKAFASGARIVVKGEANPLLGGVASEVGLMVGFDGAGSLLKTEDGLPLRRLTDSARLEWSLLARDSRDARQTALVLLQSDGAVIEEYRIQQPGSLMGFDAGEYQWPPK